MTRCRGQLAYMGNTGQARRGPCRIHVSFGRTEVHRGEIKRGMHTCFAGPLSGDAAPGKSLTCCCRPDAAPSQDSVMVASAADDIMAALDDPRLWEIGPERNVFDEHTELQPDGSQEVFDRPRLERIAANCNAKDYKGQPCPMSVGHTVDGAPETDQPPIVGYWRYFRVAWDERLQKWVIRARPYVRRDKAAVAAQYPRVSVERWPGADIFDPIAILVRTPRLDVGQWTYGRAGARQRYSMEASMPDFAPASPAGGLPGQPKPPPAAPPAPTPEGGTHDEYARMCPHIKRYMAEHLPHLHELHKKYAEEFHPPEEAPANPAEPPKLPPSGEASTPTQEAERMQKQSAAIQYQRLEQEVAALRYQAALATSERIVAQLEFEGYRIPSRQAEVERMARLDEAGRKSREEEIRLCYQKAPVGPGRGAREDFVQTARDAGPGGKRQLDRDGMTRALKYQREKGVSWDDAVAHELGTA